jgi:hypothetical protein
MRNFNKIQKQTKYVQLLKTRTPMMMMTDNIRGRELIFLVSENWGKLMLRSIARVKLVVAERCRSAYQNWMTYKAVEHCWLSCTLEEQITISKTRVRTWGYHHSLHLKLLRDRERQCSYLSLQLWRKMLFLLLSKIAGRRRRIELLLRVPLKQQQQKNLSAIQELLLPRVS